MTDNKKRKRGKRSGAAVHAAELRDIHSSIRGTRHRQDGHNLHGTSITALVTEKGIYNDHYPLQETIADHIIPRKSLSNKLLLGMFPRKYETEAVRCRQLDHGVKQWPSIANIRYTMIETTDQRATWRSDKTLLNTSKPFDGANGFYREGSVAVGLNKRKFTEYLPEDKATDMDVIIGPAADIDLPDDIE